MRRLLRGCVVLLVALFMLAPMVTTLADPSFHYHGTVVDEDGKPLAGVSIKIVDLATFRVGTGAGLYLTTHTTDANGNFTFYLDWGTYELSFAKDGYVSQTVKYAGVNVPDINVGSVPLKRSVTISLATSTLVAAPGSRFTVVVQLSNGGSTEESVNLVTTAGVGWVTALKSDAGEVKTMSLKAGSSANLNLVVDVPTDATTAGVSIVASGRVTASKTLTVYVEGEAAGLATCVYPSKTASPGETVAFKVAVSNPTEAAGVITLKVGGLPSGWSASIVNDEKDRIDSVYVAAKSTSTVTVNVDVPSTATVGATSSFTFGAALRGRSSEVGLTLKVEHATSTLALSSKYPSQSIQLGVASVYPVTLKTGSSRELVQLSTDGVPEGWSVAFKTTDGRQVNSILMEADSTESINVAVTPSLSGKQGRYNFTILAGGTAAEGRLRLTADIVGSYSLSMELDTLYIQTKAQNSEVVTVKVTNKGYSSLNNVVLDVTYPDGWTATFTPLKVTTLKPNEAVTFMLTVSVPSGAAPKDYLVTVQASSGEASATAQTIRVTVSVESSWTIYGLVLLVVAAGAFVLLYKKLRRR